MISERNSSQRVNEEASSFISRAYLKQNCSTVLKAVGFAGCVLALFGMSYISWVAGPEFQGIRSTLYWHCLAGGASATLVCAVFYYCIKNKICITGLG